MRTRRLLVVLLFTAGLVVLGPQAAFAGCTGGGGFNHSESGDAVGIGGATGCQGGGDGADPASPVADGPTGPVYEYYYTPACSMNGPPGTDSGAMCGAAAFSCQAKDEIRMFVYRRDTAGGDWQSQGSECRGADDPTRPQPQVTQAMVVDRAEQAAPSPKAMVEPSRTSYVSVPNNYYADAPDTDPAVTVLGQQIQLHFFVTDVRWDFGDGESATGRGVQGARHGQRGAVEHEYRASGSYDITATTTVGSGSRSRTASRSTSPPPSPCPAGP